jgi:diacylglycerol kinase family enzyme
LEHKNEPIRERKGRVLRHYFVINPKSFVQLNDLKRFLLSVENCFSVGNRAEYKIYISRCPRDAVAAVHRYTASVRDGETVRIYAVGGDGILFDCLNGMAEFQNAELASVPYGNANDFLCALGAENFDVFRDIKRLSGAPSVPVDLIQCGSRFALINCCIGAEAQAVMNTNGITKAANKGKYMRNFIPTLYKIGALTGILNGSIISKRYTVEVDGTDKSGVYMNINVANTAFNGGGNMPNPYAAPNDGELDIIFTGALSRLRTLSVLPEYTRGQFEKHAEAFTHLRFREMSCRSETPMTVVLDGEPFITSEITFKALPGAVKMVVPEGVGFVDAMEIVRQKQREAPHES